MLRGKSQKHKLGVVDTTPEEFIKEGEHEMDLFDKFISRRMEKTSAIKPLIKSVKSVMPSLAKMQPKKLEATLGFRESEKAKLIHGLFSSNPKV